MAESWRGSSPISRVLSNGSGLYRAAGQSFLLAPCYHDAPAAYPGAARATPWLPYLALPRMGFAVPVLLPVPRWALTRSRLRALRNHADARLRTVSPLPDPAGAAFAAPAAAASAAASLRAETRSLLFRRGLCHLAAAKPGRPSAVYSLWHFPSPHGARPLAGILLCGARTFLCTSMGAAIAWRTSQADSIASARVLVVRGFKHRRFVTQPERPHQRAGRCIGLVGPVLH